MKPIKFKPALLIVSLIIIGKISIAGLSASPEKDKKMNEEPDYSDSALAEFYIREAYKIKGNSPKASYELAHKALRLSGKINNIRFSIDAQNLIGTIKNDLGEFETALSSHILALEKAESINDKFRIATTLNYLGNVYFSQNQYQLAISYYKQSLQYAEITQTNNQILNNLYKLGRIHETLNNFQEAYKFYKRSLLIEEETKNKEGMFYSLVGIGSVCTKRQNYYQANIIYQRALKVAGELQVLSYVSLCYYHLGDLMREQKEFVKARDYYLKALVIADSLEFKKERRDCYLNLAQTNENLQFYNDAYYYLARFVEVNDTLFNQEANERKLRMQVRYDLRNKEKEIELLRQREQQNLVYKNFLIAGFILISLIAFLLFYLNRTKQKSNKLLTERNLEIEQQKEEISTSLEQLAFVNNELAKKNRQITDSILYARTIQETILPHPDVFKSYFPDSCVFFKPRDIVSGDFYWLHSHGDSRFIALADCTGHGVAGAFMSMIGYTLLNSIVDENAELSPSLILEQLNRKLISALHQKDKETSHDDGMDITVCEYNSKEKSFAFAAANHSIAVVCNNSVEVFEGDIFSIGGTFAMKENQQFKSKKIFLNPPTTVYLFSDGFQDQFGGENNEKYLSSRFFSLLENLGNSPLDQQYKILEDTFNEWKGASKQTDDILVIGLRF